MGANSDQTLDLMQSGLNLIQQAISIYSADLRLTVCNRRFREMFGLPRELVSPGAAFSDTLRYLAGQGEYGDVGDVDAFVQARVDQALAFRPHYMERQRANGNWISVEGSPLHQGGWVTVYTDISDIRRQEALLRARSEHLHSELLDRSDALSQANRELGATVTALEETKRELTEAEARVRLATETTPAHIARMDRDEIYTYSNRRLREILPFERGDIVGRNARDVLGPEVYGRIAPALHRALSGEPSVTEFEIAQDQRRVRTAFTPDTDSDGRVSGAFVLSMDVTAEAQARAVLMQTRKRELASQLTSGLAHDFSNLLTIILGLQSELETLEALPDSARQTIATTKAAALRGGALLDRLADISQSRQIRVSEVDLQEFMQETAALARATLPDQTDLRWKIDDGIDTPVLFDRGFMQDALINLVLNARDAINGPGRIDVLLGRAHDTWLEFRVHDTGSGFSPDALERALDPFFTTKRGHGSGLGLTMAYDFAQLSGGRLRLSNGPDGGAVVIVQIPWRPASGDLGSGMVLLVEDTEELRGSIRDMLIRMGMSVLEADSAEEAETLLDIPGLTHLLTDVELSGQKSGVDLVQSVSAQNRDLATLIMTGLPPQDPRRRAVPEGCHVLTKPFDEAHLRGALGMMTT